MRRSYPLMMCVSTAAATLRKCRALCSDGLAQAVDQRAEDHRVGVGQRDLAVLGLRGQAIGVERDRHEGLAAGEGVEAHLIPRATVAEDRALDTEPAGDAYAGRYGDLPRL